MAKVNSSVSVSDKDMGYKAIVTEIAKMSKTFVKVGLQDDGEKYEGEGASVAEIGYYNEFGTDIIPSRPFMRQTAERRKSELNAHIEAEHNAIVAGKKTVNVSLNALGFLYASWIQTEIREGGWVPNAPYTLKRKLAKSNGTAAGEPKPLIDTGRMIQSIRHILVDK